VTGLETAVYVIPTDAPEADGTLAWDKTTMVLVTARAGDEHGLGWSYASAAAQTVITEMLAGLVTGRSALDTAGAAEAMARQVRNIGRPGVAATAISAVDIALWDLKARLLGQSLAGLPTSGRRCPTCGTSSTSTTTSGSSGCSSTECWTRRAAR
jgi:L-alanine-DL-glutamate epimerase-like enolase superfamily enzyme